MVILVQGAEKEEINYYLEKIQNMVIEKVGGFEFYIGEILRKKENNYKIIISKTDIGEINASIATGIAIERYKPDLIINQGTCGGHDVNAKTGDLIIVKDFVYTTSFITQKSEKSSLDNWKIKEYNQNKDYLKKASEKYVEKFNDLLKKYKKDGIHVGTIASGDIWNREKERIRFLNKEYETLAEEMEVAGVYTAANRFNIPVVSIRIVSNNEIRNEDYQKEIAIESQKLLYKILENEEI